MSLLTATGLRVSRGDRVLLDDLSFSVEAGELLHFKGRNGVGKTSLIEVLVGLRKPLSGTVEHATDSRFHWIGHRNGLCADLSLQENLVDWCGLNGTATTELEPTLDRLGLRRIRHRPVRTLSMGQRRRGALARLCLDSRLMWVLDEPLSGLDIEGVELLGQMLQEHVSGGGGAFVTSHQPLPGHLPRVTVMDIA